MSPEPELLGGEPVRLGRRPEPDDEILEVEPLPTWRPPRWLVVATLLVAVVGTAGWYVDRQERAHETRALDACRSDLRTAVAYSNLRLMALADYLDPALSVTTGARHGRFADEMAQPAGTPGCCPTSSEPTGSAGGVGPALALRPGLAATSHPELTPPPSPPGCARSPTEDCRYYRDDSELQRLRKAAAIPVVAWPF